MNKVLQSDFRTTIEAFRAFIEDRPDDEKWELIDGEIVLNPTANNRHQLLVTNLLFDLEGQRRASGASWRAMPGISTRHPQDQHNEPIPDVMIVPPTSEIFNWTYDVLVVFETLSPFSLRRDMVHKKKFYTKIDSLSHYIVLGTGPARGKRLLARERVRVAEPNRRRRRHAGARRLACDGRDLSRRAGRLSGARVW